MAMQAAVKKPSGKQRSSIPPAPPLPSKFGGNIPPAPPLNLPCGSQGNKTPAPPLNLKLSQQGRTSPTQSPLRSASYGYREPWSVNLPGEPTFGQPLANSTMAADLSRSPGSPQQDLTYNKADYSGAANESYHSSDMDMSRVSVKSDHTYEPFGGKTMPLQQAPAIPRSGSIGRAEGVHPDFSPELPARQSFVKPRLFGDSTPGGDVKSPEFTFSSNPFAKPGPCDPYVGSSLVVGLKKLTFKSFIKDVDAAFVLFYKPDDENCLWAKKGMKKAALITKRPNHVFAAVDCGQEEVLCWNQAVTSVPTMKLYSKGLLVNTFNEDTFLSHSEMKRFVEKTPKATAGDLMKEQCHVQ